MRFANDINGMVQYFFDSENLPYKASWSIIGGEIVVKENFDEWERDKSKLDSIMFEKFGFECTECEIVEEEDSGNYLVKHYYPVAI